MSELSSDPNSQVVSLCISISSNIHSFPSSSSRSIVLMMISFFWHSFNVIMQLYSVTNMILDQLHHPTPLLKQLINFFLFLLLFSQIVIEIPGTLSIRRRFKATTSLRNEPLMIGDSCSDRWIRFSLRGESVIGFLFSLLGSDLILEIDILSSQYTWY